MPKHIRTGALPFLSILLFSGLWAGCNRAAVPNETLPPAEYRKISAEEAYQKMFVHSEGYILLDVRSENEYRQRHIGGAVLIPANEIGERAPLELPDKKAVILVYCQSGGRSAAAARELVSMGYINVYDFGGINDWPYERSVIEN